MDSLNPYNPFEGRKENAKYTEEQLSFIQELIKLGWSAGKIATTYNLDKEAIKKRIKNNDWSCCSNNRNASLTNEELQNIKNDVDSNIDYDVICKKYSISLEALLNRITNNKWVRTKRKNKYTFDEHYFDNIDSEHKAYWLGFLYADGYILSKRERKGKKESQSFGFSISEADNELFIKFKEDLNANNPVNYYFTSGSSFKIGSQCGRILLTSQHTVDSLKKYGLIENKTFFLKAPPIDKEFFPAFIRGYSDGDGSVYIQKNNKYGWSIDGTEEFLMSVQDFFGTKIKLSQRFPERHKNHYTLAYMGNLQVPKLLDIVYKDATIYLQRKYNKYAEMRGITV